MSGIVAVSGESVDPAIGDEMLACLRHRGPDDRGSVLTDQAYLGSQRLALGADANGQQPYANEDGSWHLVCNGRIYNHQALRQQLGHHQFKSDDGNEVILHGLEEAGPGFVAQLNGMFSFVAAGPEGIIAARDPFGIKPLYYGRDHSGNWYFASEMKSLIEHTDCFEDFPAGYYFTPRSGLVPYRPVRDLLAGLPPIEGSVEQIAAGLRERLVEAVRSQLQTEARLGFFLSGGLDSSILIAIAARELGPENVRTYSIGLKGSPATDVYKSRQVAEFLGTNHTELWFSTDEALENLSEIVYHLESFETIQLSAGIPLYFLAKAVAQEADVCLVGEGSDELLCGYQWFANVAREQGWAAVHAGMVREVHSLAFYNLHRVDRMSMAHGLELRPPFLDPSVAEYCMRIPAWYKLYGSGSDLVEKWILRKAFDGYLPDDILWRKKMGFGRDGMYDVLHEMGEEQVTDIAFKLEREMLDPAIETKTELMLFRIFRDHFGSHPAAVANVYRYDNNFGKHVRGSRLAQQLVEA